MKNKRDNKKFNKPEFKTSKNLQSKSDFKISKNLQGKPRKRDFDDDDDGFQIEGRNSVLEALNHDKTIDKIFVKRGEIEGTLRVIVAKAIEKGIIIKEIDKIKMEQMKRTNNPQGVIAFCPVYEYSHTLDILQKARDKGEDPFIIILDEITDPHNLGAIIRTADAVGAHGVIIPKRRSVSLTTTVSKTSSGALEYVPVARVTNITKEIQKLQKEGLWVTCADMKGTICFNADLKGPVAIVIGSEGNGVSELVRKTCDFSVKIPMYGNIASLNASVASSVLMYEVIRQRNFLQG